MPPFDLAIAILALLLTPGPTNTLMLLAGTERGWRASWRLIPAELAGYAVTVVPLTLVGASFLAAMPGLRVAGALVAAVWVAVLALRLWQRPAGDSPAANPVGAWSVFVTTALNPKALIFGLVLLPAPDRLAANLLIFGGCIILVAAIWTGIGARLRGAHGHGQSAHLLRRLASLALVAMSLLLVARGVLPPA